MPGRDGTGPTGRGSKTGRGVGPCTNNNARTQPSDTNYSGNGFGRGSGRGQNTRGGVFGWLRGRFSK